MMRPSGNEFQDYCTMAGLMLLTWSWAENTLALIIGVINENAGPIKGFPEAPLSLKKRIACLKVALRDIAPVKPLQEEGRVLVARFVELAPRRHDFVHGAAWQSPEGGFQSVSFRAAGGNYATHDHRFNVKDARLLAVEIAELQDSAADFLTKVVGALTGG
jgi:hypothetical protein